MRAEDAWVPKTHHAKSGKQDDRSKIQEASWKKIAKPTAAASSIEAACSLEAAWDVEASDSFLRAKLFRKPAI